MFFMKRKAEIDTNEVKKDIKKMTKLATSMMIDQKALIRADFVRKGMNLNKFRKEVMDEMSESSGDEADKQSENVPQILFKSIPSQPNYRVIISHHLFFHQRHFNLW